MPNKTKFSLIIANTMLETPKVCLVIVTWNRLEILKDPLQKIHDQMVAPKRIIIVDNGSTDGTIAFLEKLSSSSEQITALFIPDNPGFGAGLAAGMEKGLEMDTFDYYWLMDDDSKPNANTLASLIETIDQYQFDMLGLKGYEMVWGQPKLVREKNVVKAVDYVLVDGALIKGEVVQELGVIGKHFFMMCEDYDYCLRLGNAGKKIGVFNAAYERLHLGSERFSKGTRWRGYYHAKNHLLILKEYPSLQRIVGYILRQSKYLIAALWYAPDRWQRVRLRLKGIWDGLLGRKGKTLDPAKL